MKTSLIRYRVADFLKQHPPFDALPETDLHELAGTGRVSFHETAEHVFRRGRPRKPCIWVIQQGAVEIIDETEGEDRLSDLLGSGDILGLFDLLGGESYSRSARTLGDVILYSIDAAAFEAQAAKHPRMARYLAAYFSITEGQEGFHKPKSDGHRSPAGSCFEADTPSVEFLKSRSLVAAANCTIHDAVTLMVESGRDSLVIANQAQHPLGIVTLRQLSTSVTSGVGTQSHVVDVMEAAMPAVARAGLAWSEYLRTMMRDRRQLIVMTQDGTDASPLEGILTAQDVSLLLGTNPVLLQTQLLRSKTVVEWKTLLAQVKAFLIQALTGPAVLEHAAIAATFLYDALVESIIAAAQEEMATQGHTVPEESSCWLMLGRSGRGEIIEPLQPEVGIVYANPAAKRSEAAAEYFSLLAEKVNGHIIACGLRPGPSENRPPLSMTQGAWEEMLQGIVIDPIVNDIYRMRGCLDFRAFHGDRNLERALADVTTKAMHKSKPFIPILANDTLANLPPLTFFQGLVIELDGAQTDLLDLEATALHPIVDAVRVYALANRNLTVSNTLERLTAASDLAPQAESLFNEVASAFRTVSYYHAAAALTQQSAGSTMIRPNQLSKYEQRMLKLAFQTIRSLMELISSGFLWHDAP